MENNKNVDYHNPDEPIFNKLELAGMDDVTDDDAPTFLGSLTIRRWIYRIAIAVLVIVMGFISGISIAEQDWTALILAILGLTPAAGLGIANNNVRN